MTSAAPSSPVRIALEELLALGVDLPAWRVPQELPRQAGDGGRPTRWRGRGMDFAEVRPYQAGDEIRNLDWRVTARRGRPHTKLFHEERERPLLVAVDYRRPMFFATRGCYKAVQAARLAALLGWNALRRGDRFGLALFSDDAAVELRPRRGRSAVLQALRLLAEDPAWQRPAHQPFVPAHRLEQQLARLHQVVRPGSQLVLLTDGNQWDSAVEQQLAQLRRHADLAVLLCYDPFERQLPATLPTQARLTLSDGHARLALTAAELQRQLHQPFAVRWQRLASFCQDRGALFLPCATNDDAGTWLAARPQLWRGRP
ncbi:MAG: DUF58 domain-containing protein [Desulfuromonas thiophila]|nr:DUF58 domain-containing protein [Desulfuromonas thiophila]